MLSGNARVAAAMPLLRNAHCAAAAARAMAANLAMVLSRAAVVSVSENSVNSAIDDEHQFNVSVLLIGSGCSAAAENGGSKRCGVSVLPCSQMIPCD